MKLNINKENIKILAGSLIVTVGLSLGGKLLYKKLSCQKEEEHAHLYTAFNGLKRYADSEKSIYKWMFKNKNKYINLNQENKELIKFLDDNDLYSIDENIEILNKKIENKKDYIEYEYIDNITDELNNTNSLNNDTNEKEINSNWTKNKYKNGLTGKARDCHFVYQAYKVYKDNGEYKLEKSKQVDNLFDIKDEYKYITDFYYQINKSDIYQVDVDNKKVK